MVAIASGNGIATEQGDITSCWILYTLNLHNYYVNKTSSKTSKDGEFEPQLSTLINPDIYFSCKHYTTDATISLYLPTDIIMSQNYEAFLNETYTR